MAKSRPPTVEYLEDRSAPAVFGLPWRDATHLTLSFTPDGTPIAGHRSELSEALSRRFPSPDAWREFSRDNDARRIPCGRVYDPAYRGRAWYRSWAAAVLSL